MESKKIAILTNILPTYREDFYDHIFADHRFVIKVFCQKKLPNSNVKTIDHKYGDLVEHVNFTAPFGDERLVFQYYPFWKIFRNYDMIVVDGNLRNLLLFIYSVLFVILGKKVIVWSNVYSADGNPVFQKLRLRLWKIFNYFLMYTEKDRDILLENGFQNKTIVPINNGLNQKHIDDLKKNWTTQRLLEFKQSKGITSHNIVISSGRINEVNQHMLALEAIYLLIPKIPDILWIVIGNGTMLNELESKVKTLKLEKNVLLLGEIYEEEQKCPWFMISDVLVHPGPIGLTVFNTFGYELAVITHNNKSNHGPEFFLFEENRTGYLFQEHQAHDLSDKIYNVLTKKGKLKEMGQYSYSIVKEKHNTNKMAENFTALIEKL